MTSDMHAPAIKQTKPCLPMLTTLGRLFASSLIQPACAACANSHAITTKLTMRRLARFCFMYPGGACVSRKSFANANVRNTTIAPRVNQRAVFELWNSALIGCTRASMPSANINCHANGLHDHPSAKAAGSHCASCEANSNMPRLPNSTTTGLRSANGTTNGTASANIAYMGNTADKYG